MTIYAVRMLTIIGYAISILVFAVTIPIMALGLLLLVVIIEIMEMLDPPRNVPSHVSEIAEKIGTAKVDPQGDESSSIRKKVL